jgi:hypothetical protein
MSPCSKWGRMGGVLCRRLGLGLVIEENGLASGSQP